MHKLYDELAGWWQLISAPADYAEEAAFYLSLLAEVTTQQPATLLELGSGGGNNALYMKKAFAAVTLVDLSPQMLAVSRQLNPDCEHLPGDMRTVRLERQFDVVFIHDAIDYITTLADLRQTFATAFLHCKPGGMVLLVPDHVQETFQPTTEHGGEDGAERAARYLEWSYDPDPNDSSYSFEFIVLLREADGSVTVEHDRHIMGLFPRDDWLRLLQEAGFAVEFVIDAYDRYNFIGRKPGRP